MREYIANRLDRAAAYFHAIVEMGMEHGFKRTQIIGEGLYYACTVSAEFCRGGRVAVAAYHAELEA